MRATAPQLSDIACRFFRTLHSNSIIALTQFPGDMPPTSRTFRAAAILPHNLHSGARMRWEQIAALALACAELKYIACAVLHVATEHACQHSPLTLAQRSE